MVADNGCAGVGSGPLRALQALRDQEMFDIGMTGCDRRPAVHGFREAVQRDQGAALAEAADLLRALATTLDLDPAFFGESMRHQQCLLRVLRSPPACLTRRPTT